MQLFNLLAAATLAATTTAFEIKMQVHYNATYDRKAGFNSPQTDSICLDNNTFNALGLQWPDDGYKKHEFFYPYPYVGGYAPIKKDDNASCFNCYQLQYGGKNISFRAMNTAKDGVDLGKQLFEELSGGKVAELKHINATISMIDSEHCILDMQIINNPLPGVMPSIGE